ncbi:hypothetical protein ACIBQX_36995 [Nonomuraea sp. NPDC049714]
MSVLVVTGTDAAVGQTMVTAAVAALALGRGHSCRHGAEIAKGDQGDQ